MIDLPSLLEIQEFVIEQMKTNQWFQTVGFFGILGIVWQYTKTLPQYAWTRIERKLLFTANIEEKDEFFNYFESWLNRNHKQVYRNVQVGTSSKITGNSRHNEYPLEDSENPEEEETLKYKQFQDIFFIRRGFVIIRVFKGREQLQNASSIDNAFYNHFKLSALFGKKVITTLMQEVLEGKKKQDLLKEGKNIGVWTNTNHYWEREEDFEPKDLTRVISPSKDLIMEDIQEFLNSKDWYKERSIPYKRGYMFYGKPGSGKTSLSLALAKHFKKDAYVLNPSGVKDNELRELFRGLNKNSILLIEDIDATFNSKRDKKDSDIKFNFSTLLNCLDGVFSKEGVITIFTTNHISSLDEALIRKGRIDLQIEISNPTWESINSYLSLFYEKVLAIDKFIDNDALSMAEVQEICLQNKENYKKALGTINGIIKNQDKIN